MRDKKRRRKIIAIVALLLILLLLLAAYVNYRATRRFGFEFIGVDQDALLEIPEYLFSFSGPEDDPLHRPIGVFIDRGRVFVPDGERGVIDVFDLDGERLETWGKDILNTPLYITKNPATGEYWVSDRRTRSIHIFSQAGVHLGEFDPNLPEAQLPTFDTRGHQWAPVDFAFAPDGSLYVLEILKGHRLLVFDSQGEFVRSVGTSGFAPTAADEPGVFQFPNSIMVKGEEVWVTDSNNRRVQIFDLAGDFLRLIPFDGLPRGLDFLKWQSEENTAAVRFATVDTLAHDVTIWQADPTSAERLLSFGGNGVLEGQFSYPTDISVAGNGRLYISDTANSRIQVWGWPALEQPVPTPKTPLQWLACLSPLLLLLIPLLRRKRKRVATPDFVHEMFELEKAHLLPEKRVDWFVRPEDFEPIKGLEQDEVKAEELFEEFEPSDSDVRSLMDKLEIPREQAEVLAIAQRVHLLCTEDVEIRRLAKVLDLDVVDHVEYIERYGKQDADRDENRASGIE